MIILVLAIITLVVVALAITGAFGKINNLFNKVSDLEVAAQACEQYASVGLKTSYCNTFQKVELNGKVQYANCEYLKNHGAVFDDKEIGNCSVDDNFLKEFCVNKKLGDEEMVNGKTCEKLKEGNSVST